ncbi:MAG: hypothetical protein EBS90_07405 [Betaproteobacteria bacterium]|nr:hypothetical protein [Betaproteobacteria bacterium]
MYEDVVCNYDLQWAITNGWSVSPRCKLARVDGLDLSGVKIVGGDFNQSQLQAAVEKEANLHRIAMITEQEREGQTVVFCTSVASARGVCHYLQNNYGVPAVYVYGTMPDDERADGLESGDEYHKNQTNNIDINRTRGGFHGSGIFGFVGSHFYIQTNDKVPRNGRCDHYMSPIITNYCNHTYHCNPPHWL